jgi:hypothetical protein
VEPATNDVPLGTDSVEGDGVDPRPDDNARSLHHDLVVCGAGRSSPRFTALGDAVPALGSSSTVGLG